jgi:beta-glucosidase
MIRTTSILRPLVLILALGEASAAADDPVAELLAKMTLQEKIGQLSQFSDGAATGPDQVQVDQNRLATQGGIGSMLNVSGAAQTNALQRHAVEGSRLGIPILFALDIIHGYRTVYPIPLGMSCSWNPQLIEQCARMAAVEGTAEGIRWTFSPMVDVTRDARWGRVMEGSGEDHYLGQVLAAAWVRGYQDTELSKPTSMLACAKHFVAYGAAEGGREYDQVDLSERTLREIYLPPFRAALDEGVATFMSGFNTIGGVPTSANPHTLRDILRREWGFRGFVVSDWNSIGELIAHGVALDGRQAALKAFSAGVDMDMQGNLYIAYLDDLVASGQVSEEDIDASVARVLRMKYALGLFEDPYTDEALGPSVHLNTEHLQAARRAAEESFVLLKNASRAGAPVLPLDVDANVALIGPLADSGEDMLGNWSLRGRGEDVVTLRQALADRLGNRLAYAEGCDVTEESRDGFAEALEAARRSDVVLMALGESRQMSGEAASRSELGLPGVQLELLKQIVATGKPVVLVLFSGRPLAIPWEANNVPAILAAWFPGVQAGPALHRTLFGEVSPTGKLTASFPHAVGQMPLYYNCLNTGRPMLGRAPGEGHITGYRDLPNTALFPFGWGMTYTTFDYSPTRASTERISVEALQDGGLVAIEATVENSGPRPGDEVVQLYIRHRGTSVARPIRELKGFRRMRLAPGESRVVRFELTREELANWDLEMRHRVEPGQLTVWVAPHSRSGTPVEIALESRE